MHKSTPVEALRLEVGAESFRTTAKRSAAVAYEKAMRLPALSHPTSRIARYPARRRLRRGTDWRCLSVGVASHVGLNAFQRLDLPPPTAPPWEKGKESWSISLTLKGGSGKDTPAEVLLADALRTIRSYRPDVTFYTDGSATGGLTQGGSAIVLPTGDPQTPNVQEVRHQKGPEFTTSFETEAWALLRVGEWSQEWPDRRVILVCSESQSALAALQRGDVKGHTTLVRLYRLLWSSPHR